MRESITDEFFLKSVQTTKKVMENSANHSEPMCNVAREIGKFLGTINTTTNHNLTYNASRDLYNVLIK